MPPTLEKAFVGSSRAMGKLSSRTYQLARAKALSDRFSALENKIGISSKKLQCLISVLANAFKVDEHQAEITCKIDEHHDALVSKLDNMRIRETVKEVFIPVTSRIDENHDAVLSKLESLRLAETVKEMKMDENHDAILSKLDCLPVVETAKEVYIPLATAPAPSHTVILDFDLKDEKRHPKNPEGLLKQSALHGQSPGMVIAATGVTKPVYGVLGMAGVGKTVSLQGLGHDEEVKKRFHDGVLYMTFGRGATLQIALREIAKIMTLTGATTSVENVKNATCLRDAVDYAVMWFEGKVCLFLLDDLWPAENLPHGYFHDLRQLLRASPHSRMAISTRSVLIASEAGHVVDFAPRHPLGKVAVDMFMSHATAQWSPQSSRRAIHDLRSSVSKILSICGGLPIALSVTGCAVSKLTRIYGTFDKACDVYAVKIERKRRLLGEKCAEYGSSLKAAIMLSLEYLEVEFLEWVRENSMPIDSSIFDLYTSLCVLSNQAWVPVSVLRRLWKLEEDAAFDVASLVSGMSLATLTVRRLSSEMPDEAGIVLHDLQLDFCQRHAEESKTLPLWHAQILNGYLETPPRHRGNAEVLGRIIECASRPWWSDLVPEAGYIHTNLCRHLKLSVHGIEQAALLLDGRWTLLRRRIGGILALETDFELLDNVLRKESCNDDIRRGFEHVLKAVRLSWGRMVKGPRVFQFHVCSRLTRMRKSNAVVEAYLKSIEKCTPKPYLLPVSSFFPGAGSSLIMEIPVAGKCSSVACSPCGRYIACGAGSDIVIASNGEIIQRMQSDRDIATSIAFAGGSKTIVSSSLDGVVMLWEWELSKYSVRFFEGHDNYVTGAAADIDGRRIFSSSWDGTLKIWDATTNAQACELPQESGVYCIAACGRSGMIAIGLRNGKLKVIDSVRKDVLSSIPKDVTIWYSVFRSVRTVLTWLRGHL